MKALNTEKPKNRGKEAAFKVAQSKKKSIKTKFTEDDFIALEKGIFPRKDKVIDYIYDDQK
jgi:hypothetical protein